VFTIYKDGHEREDAIKYRESTFLPLIMNLGPGGKQQQLRNGFNPLTQPQAIQNVDDVPKGTKRVLEERELWQADLPAQCKMFNPDLAAEPSGSITRTVCLEAQG
jgi:hypothetical protein